jgi:hypothetical protein
MASDVSTTPAGAGLGLAIAKEIVEPMAERFGFTVKRALVRHLDLLFRALERWERGSEDVDRLHG